MLSFGITLRRSLVILNLFYLSLLSVCVFLFAHVHMYRARFELLCSPLFNKCVEAIRELLDQSGFTADDINKVMLLYFLNYFRSSFRF
jgi:hypothetical protein